MALVSAQAARFQPENELAQALRDYEAILTDEQKVQFRSQNGGPGATAAISLTVDLDRENSSRRSRCVGTRLMTFLESAQQFTSIVDTFINSNPNIAALTWGGVKMALLAANNFSSYFDKLSTLFMNIGSSCPRYADFGLLYPNSARLQKALCDYYAIVIRLCTQAIEFSRKSGFFQLSNAFITPFETKFGSFQKDLERQGHVIREEISLVSKRLKDEEAKFQSIERQDASNFRAKLKNMTSKEHGRAHEWRLQAGLRESKRMQLEFLTSLSDYNHLTAWKQARKKCLSGTSKWMSLKPEFEQWMFAPCSSILRCTGILGAGKTVLSASVIAHLTATLAPRDTIAFFFCRYDDAVSLLTRTIIGSIARQLLASLPLNSFSETESHNSGVPPDIDQIVEILERLIPKTQQCFVIIDGLDECEQTEAKMVVSAMQSLLASPMHIFKFYLSSRPDMYQWVPKQPHLDWHVSMALEDIDPDISSFIDSTLEHCIEEGKLQLGDPCLISTIQDTLVDRAQGMFLWVNFQIETLCSQKSDNDILDTLKGLPKSLPETFDRILGKLARMDEADVRNGTRIFKWLATARRPLTLEELREAISIEPCQPTMVSGNLINSITQALIGCGSLVTVDEEDSTVHFVHHSIKQYLLSAVDNPLLQKYHFDLETADIEAGEICITYLRFKELTTQVAKIPKLDISASQIPSTVLRASIPQATTVSRIALKLLKSKRDPNYSLHRNLEEIAGITEANRLRQAQLQYSFLPYARKFWLLHTRALRPDSNKIWRMWIQVIKDDSVDKPWTTSQSSFWKSNILSWIIQNDHSALLLYQMPGIDFEEFSYMDELVRSGIKLMTAGNKTNLLRIFVQYSPSISWLRNKLLIPLAGLGDLGLFRLAGFSAHYISYSVKSAILGEYGIRCTCFDEEDIRPSTDLTLPKSLPDLWSVLVVATAYGHEHIVEQILFDHTSSICVDPHERKAISDALIQAAVHGYPRIADALLDYALAHKIRIINRTSYSGWTSLMYVVYLGDLGMVKKMIKLGVDVNESMKPISLLPLDIAISRRYKLIEDFLESNGARTKFYVSEYVNLRHYTMRQRQQHPEEKPPPVGAANKEFRQLG